MYQIAAFPYRVDWPTDGSKSLVTTGEQFEGMLRWLQANQLRIFDHETTGLQWFKDDYSCGLGLGVFDSTSPSGVRSWYVPYRHQTGEGQLDIETIRDPMRRLFAEPDAVWIAHNFKFDEHMNRREGWHIGGRRYCTQMAARLYDENKPVALKKRAYLDLGHYWASEWEKRLDEEVNRLAKARKMKKTDYMATYGYCEVAIDLCGFYCCYDVDFTGQLFSLYERWGLSSHFPRVWNNEMQLIHTLCDMEEYGCLIDVDYVQYLKAETGKVIDRLSGMIEPMFRGSTFNPGSDADLRSFLYEHLMIPATTRTKKNQPSVEADVLAAFAHLHPAIPLIMEWREADKIRTTWTDSILKKLDHNGVLHGSLQNEGTTSGRLSSSSPNLQNFANENDDRAVRLTGRHIEDGGHDPWSIRRAFIARKRPDGVVIPRVILDYEQIELKALAYYTKDPIMTDAFLKGEDIHQRTQVEVGAILGGGPAPRRLAKITAFGLSYCMSAKGLSRQAKIPEDEAERFMEAFFGRYSSISNYREAFWAKVRFEGCQFANMFGRPRRVPGLTSDDNKIRKSSERQSFGALIQGTAAQLTKESLVRIHKWLRETGYPAVLVSTVHDEIWIDCDPSCLTVVVPKVKQLMEDYPEFAPIPITASADYIDTNWAEKKKLPL